jgi:hypothetical protein
LLPKFSGQNFTAFLELLEKNKEIWEKIPNFEITINDYWVIQHIQNILPKVKFVNGTYIAHQHRDAQI